MLHNSMTFCHQMTHQEIVSPLTQAIVYRTSLQYSMVVRQNLAKLWNSSFLVTALSGSFREPHLRWSVMKGCKRLRRHLRLGLQYFRSVHSFSMESELSLKWTDYCSCCFENICQDGWRFLWYHVMKNSFKQRFFCCQWGLSSSASGVGRGNLTVMIGVGYPPPPTPSLFALHYYHFLLHTHTSTKPQPSIICPTGCQLKWHDTAKEQHVTWHIPF